MVTRRFGLGTVLLSASLGGCAVYSDGVNQLGPERPVSDLRLQAASAELELSGTRPLFCPAPEIVMVMPEENRGIISVGLNNEARYRLAGDYAGIRISEQSVETFTGDQDELMTLYGEAIRALPPAPTYYTVYFETNTTTLTPESRALIDGIYREVTERPVPAVVVIGHTDTRASEAYNLELSMERAELVRGDLIARGVDADMIRLDARGESDLLVPTADNVDEPKNRRVVINVR